MRILIFHQFYTKLSEPGIARFSIFAKEWRKLGAVTDVIASSRNHTTGGEVGGSSFYSKEKDESDVTIYRAASWTFGFGYWTFLGRVLAYLSFTVTSFFTALLAPRPDIIVASAPPIFLGLVAWLVAAIRRVPFAYETRDIWPDEAIELGVLRNKLVIRMSFALERFIYARARKIVVNSPGVKELLTVKKNIDGEKIAVIPNPIVLEEDKVDEKETRKRLDWNDKFVVLYSGAHAFVYDFDTLLDAAKLLKDQKDIEIVLMGGGRYKEHVANRVKEENISNVRLLSAVPHDEVRSYMRAADLCVASLKDMEFLRYIYATKLLNYMESGRPILLAMRGVSKELVERAGAGLVVPPGDAGLFAETLNVLKRDPKRLTEMGISGRKFIAEYANAARLANEYFDLLQRIVSS